MWFRLVTFWSILIHIYCFALRSLSQRYPFQCHIPIIFVIFLWTTRYRYLGAPTNYYSVPWLSCFCELKTLFPFRVFRGKVSVSLVSANFIVRRVECSSFVKYFSSLILRKVNLKFWCLGKILDLGTGELCSIVI